MLAFPSINRERNDKQRDRDSDVCYANLFRHGKFAQIGSHKAYEGQDSRQKMPRDACLAPLKHGDFPSPEPAMSYAPL